MTKVTNFEDLIAWQKARVLARDVYALTKRDEFRRDFGLASQLQRAAVSVMANLAEGFERRRRTEFFRFVEIAKGSAAEVLSHLYIALDVGYLAQPEFEVLHTKVSELQRVLGGLKNSLGPESARTPRLGPRASELGPSD